MNTILEQAKNAIQQWNEARNNPIAATAHFNQGAFFEITKEAFETWNSLSPEYIHAYLGLQPLSSAALTLYCIDSTTDTLAVIEHSEDFTSRLYSFTLNPSTLKQGAFLPALNSGSTDVASVDALKASVRWHLQKEQWASQQTAQQMVQVFDIPFQNFELLFSEEQVHSILLLPALKTTEHQELQIDLMLWGYNHDKGIVERPVDFIKPAPPFSKQAQYQLLVDALQIS